MSFYQLVRNTGYSIASALSATALVLSIHSGHTRPANVGYSTAALISIAVLLAALALSTALHSASRTDPRTGRRARIVQPDLVADRGTLARRVRGLSRRVCATPVSLSTAAGRRAGAKLPASE
jgi:hypothetical protein